MQLGVDKPHGHICQVRNALAQKTLSLRLTFFLRKRFFWDEIMHLLLGYCWRGYVLFRTNIQVVRNTDWQLAKWIKNWYSLSLIKYPMAPIIKNPKPTAWLIFKNSRLSAKKQRTHQQLKEPNIRAPSTATRKEIMFKEYSADIRFVHLFIKSMPSLTKSLGTSASSWNVSDMLRWNSSEDSRKRNMYSEEEQLNVIPTPASMYHGQAKTKYLSSLAIWSISSWTQAERSRRGVLPEVLRRLVFPRDSQMTAIPNANVNFQSCKLQDFVDFTIGFLHSRRSKQHLLSPI